MSETQHESTKSEIVDDAVATSHSTRGRRLLGILTAVLVIGMLATGLSGYALYKSLHSSATAGVDLAQQVKQACKQKGSQTSQIKRLCNDASNVIEGAPVEPGPPGATGAPGPGPTNSQVSLAVANFCASGNCQGPGPSPAQVAQAVALYCNQRGQCQGPAGPQGKPGQNATGAPGATGAAGSPGADSTVPGPQGPGPTDQQIADAVNNYCTNHGNCQGPQGPQGDTGVVAVNSDACAPQDGQVIASVSATYDADARRITLSCTYANAVIVPGGARGRN